MSEPENVAIVRRIIEAFYTFRDGRVTGLELGITPHHDKEKP